MRYYKEFFCSPRLTTNAHRWGQKRCLQHCELRLFSSWGSHFTSHLAEKQHFSRPSYHLHLPQDNLKRLGGGKVYHFWTMQYSWTNSTSSLHIPFGEGWDHVTSSASQNQGNHLSNLAVPEKRGVMGGIMSLLERCVEVLTLSTSECDLIWVNICRCN